MDGRLEQRNGVCELRFSRQLAHPPEKVWRALTEPEHLAAWFPSDIEGERKAGAKLRFVFRDEGPTLDGEMLVFDPPSLLEFRWGDDTLRFEVQPDGTTGSVLTFVNTFGELGRAARDAAGWHACLDVLEYELDGKDAPWSPKVRWGDV